MSKDLMNFGGFNRIGEGYTFYMYTMLQGGQSSGSGFKKARVRGLLSTFAFLAMNNQENETGYTFSSDQTLEKMYVLMECIRYKGYNQTFFSFINTINI